MSWESAVIGRMLDAPTVATIVGQQVDLKVRAQSAPLPGIVLEVIDDPRPQTHDGADSIRPSLARVHCMAATSADAIALRETVIPVLTPAGLFGGVWFDNSKIEHVRDTGGDTEAGFVHRESIDIIFWHKG